MKYKLLILLISFSTICNAENFTYLGHTLNISGFVNHTYNSENVIADDGAYAAVNITVSNEYGFVSSQIASNKYNPVRRLYLNLPIYTENDFNAELMIGRLNNPVGFINTIIQNPYSNQAIMLPISTYDPRRYNNLPDITDGLEIKLSKVFTDFTMKMYGWYGKQLIDNKDIDVYGSHFSLTGNSDYMYGIKFKVYNDDYAVQYTHTYTEGTITSTNPSMFINYLDRRTFQRLQFLSFSYKFDDFKIQSETSYRELNAATNTIGTYLNISYNFKDNWNAYIGHSYGTREKEVSTINDTFLGISNKIGNFDIGLEYHHIETNNWYFNYNQDTENSYDAILTSVTFNF